MPVDLLIWCGFGAFGGILVLGNLVGQIRVMLNKVAEDVAAVRELVEKKDQSGL